MSSRECEPVKRFGPKPLMRSAFRGLAGVKSILKNFLSRFKAMSIGSAPLLAIYMCICGFIWKYNQNTSFLV